MANGDTGGAKALVTILGIVSILFGVWVAVEKIVTPLNYKLDAAYRELNTSIQHEKEDIDKRLDEICRRIRFLEEGDYEDKDINARFRAMERVVNGFVEKKLYIGVEKKTCRSEEGLE